MISSLLFLISILLVASSAPFIAPTAWTPSPDWGFVFGLTLYLLTLGLIVVQNGFFRGRTSVNRLLLAANLELLTVLLLFHFFFLGQRLLMAIPVLGKSLTFLSLFPLSLYFLGLGLFYSTIHARKSAHLGTADQQIRLLVPFALPFLLFCLLSDFASLLPPIPWLQPHNELGEWVIAALFSILFLGSIMLIMPVMIVHLWRCRPLPKNDLHLRLEVICETAGFKHAGMLTWPLMSNAITAAIVGIVPRFRYIMFTQGMLEKLSPTSIEAVLAHEMGHSRRKHLLLYPIILLGALVAIWSYQAVVAPSVNQYFQLRHEQEPFGPWQSLHPVAMFLPNLLILLLYLRFIFGYFSRLFERQADLTVFDLGMPAEQMITALDEVAIHAGRIHLLPSWHHYSIQQRMDFLAAAIKNPELVSRHHRRVRRALLIYLLILISAIMLALFFFGTSMETLA